MDGRQWPVGASGAATFSYDGAKRPTAFAKAGSAAASFSQTHDRDGNVTAEGRSLSGVSGDAGTSTQSFTYDGANRVSAASGLTSSASYAYDRDTNRTSATLGGVTTTYAYDRTAELISRTDGGTTTYLASDAYGNQTSAAPAVNANTAATYDLADRLTSITPPASSATTFGFDALGRNLSRVTPAGSDAYEYVGVSETVWRITTAGTPVSSALDPSGARLASTKSGTSGFLLADLHRNLAAVVNAGETALLAATRYDAFGQTAAAYDSGGTFPTPWRFAGRLDLSPDAHPLYDLGARNYDPATGAFTQLDSYADSPGDPLSLNRFAYAEANPWTLIDPDGHMPLPVGYDDQRGPVVPLPRPPAALTQQVPNEPLSPTPALTPASTAVPPSNSPREVQSSVAWWTHWLDGITSTQKDEIAVGSLKAGTDVVAALRKLLSDAGRTLSNRASSAQAKSEAARLLATLGKKMKYLGPEVKVFGRLLAPLGIYLEYQENRDEGRSPSDSVGRTAASTLGSLGGMGLAALGCAAFEIAAPACFIVTLALGFEGGNVGKDIYDSGYRSPYDYIKSISSGGVG